jgi:hypothetical protein
MEGAALEESLVVLGCRREWLHALFLLPVLGLARHELPVLVELTSACLYLYSLLFRW